MATSGSINFSVTRSNILEDALAELGIFREGSDITSSEYTNAVTHCSRALNRMIKAWMMQGHHLWTLTEATVFFDEDTKRYKLGSGGDEAANELDVVETTLASAGSSGSTTLTLTTVTGMAVSDVILIELDDGSVHSTTISSIDTTAITVVIATALASAAAASNAVYTYTTLLERPLKIVSARLRDKDGRDRELQVISHDEYFMINDKDQEGSPNVVYYDPQRDNGYLYVWPRPDSMKERLKITYYRTIEDFDAASDNPDFPVEWSDALVLGLAARVARTYGKDDKLIRSLKLEAEQALYAAMLWDNESTSVSMIPDMDQ